METCCLYTRRELYPFVVARHGLDVGKCHEIENLDDPGTGIVAGQRVSLVTGSLGSYILGFGSPGTCRDACPWLLAEWQLTSTMLRL